MKMQTNSLAARLMRFFNENPGEELTYADIEVKFGVTYHNVSSTVNRLKQLGQLDSVHVVRLKPKREPAP